MTLKSLADTLDAEQPSIRDTAARLSSLQERHGDGAKDSGRKKPKYSVEKSPVLNHTAFYLLPEAVLDKCFEVLPIANKKSEAIPVFTQSQPEDGQQMGASGQQLETSSGQHTDVSSGQQMGTPEDKGIECVTVAGFGTFSRTQIEAMRRLQKLKKDCEEGQRLVKWLRRDISDFLHNGLPHEIAAELESKYPYSIMPGFTNDYTFEALYRLRPSLWVSDAMIGAFCERVCNDASQVRYLGVLERKPTTGRLRRQPVSDDMKVRISKAALEETTDALIIPVNFSNAHWTLVMVLLAAKEILYYDSMGGTHSLNVLSGVAQDIGNLLHDVNGSDFKVTSVSSPRQFDGYSCGVFVCHKIATLLDCSASQDVSVTGLDNLRFRLLAYVLRGKKL